jgi:hypothetical protein
VSPYEVLGVEPSASAEELRRAYLQLARRHHPDQYATASDETRVEAERRMQEINEAWSLLGDRFRRARVEAEWAEAQASTFRPFAADDDEPDPRLAPDVPYRPTRPVGPADQAMVLAPVGLLLVAAGAGGLGLIVGLPALVGLGFLLLVLSFLGFLVAPLVALSRAKQDEG